MLAGHDTRRRWLCGKYSHIMLTVLAILLFAFAPLSLAGVSADGPGGIPGRLWNCSEIVDRWGNIYAYGTYTDSLQIGSHTIVSPRQLSFFIAKLTPAGEWAWVKTIPGVGLSGHTIPVVVSFGKTGALRLSGPFEASGFPPEPVFTQKATCSTAILGTGGDWISGKPISASEYREHSNEAFLRTPAFSSLKPGDDSPRYWKYGDNYLMADRRSVGYVASLKHTLWELDFGNIQSLFVGKNKDIYVWGTDNGGATIAKTDSSGFWAWKHEFTSCLPENTGWGYFCETSDGRLLFQPDKGSYVSIDDQGRIAWTASVGGSQEIVFVQDRIFAEGGAIWYYGESYVIRRPDGKGGWKASGNPRLQRIGPDGQVERSLPVLKPEGYDLWSMDINNAGDFIIVWIDEKYYKNGCLRRGIHDPGILVSSYDADMRNRWSKKFNGVANSFDIVVCPDGVYTGFTTNTDVFAIQGIPVTTEGQIGVLCVKLDFAGNIAWKYRADVYQAYYDDFLFYYGPILGSSGELYIYGSDYDHIDLHTNASSTHQGRDTLAVYSEEGFFVARIGTNGKVDWVNTYSLGDYYEIRASLDGSGNLYIYGNVGLDPIQIGDKSIPGSFGRDEWYLAIIDRDGNCTRIKVFDDWGELHCLNGDSSVYLIRGQDSEEFIAYDDPQTGPTDAFAQIKIYDTEHDRLRRQTLDCEFLNEVDRFFTDGLGGYCLLTSSFPPKYNYCESSAIVMLDKNLKVVLQKELPFTEVVYDDEGNLYGAGYMEGFVNVEGPLFGSAPAEAYLAKIAPNGEILWAKRCVDLK